MRVYACANPVPVRSFFCLFCFNCTLLYIYIHAYTHTHTADEEAEKAPARASSRQSKSTASKTKVQTPSQSPPKMASTCTGVRKHRKCDF